MAKSLEQIHNYHLYLLLISNICIHMCTNYGTISLSVIQASDANNYANKITTTSRDNNRRRTI